MTEDQRLIVSCLQKEISDLESEKLAVQETPAPSDLNVWTELAKTLFTVKEFLYVR
jgi:hypothetical protein